MNEQALNELLGRYLNGRCTPAEEQLIWKWYEELGADMPPQHVDADLARKIRERISERLQLDQRATDSGHVIRRWHFWSAAATVVILLVFAFLIPRNPLRSDMVAALRQTDSLQGVTPAQTVRELTLPDGSTVRLQPESTLDFDHGSFMRDRTVRLTGEAYFEVVSMRENPFSVRTGVVTTRVTGTSFIVRALDREDDISVAVRTGQVSVSAAAGNEKDNVRSVTLIPDQQVRYSKNRNTLEKDYLPTKVSADLVTEEVFTVMRFDNTPLREVLSDLSSLYEINIEMDSSLSGDCPFTASFKDQSLYTRLEMICKAVHARYSVVEGEGILVSGGRCQ